MKKAVIFDVDGTLWDAADAMALGWTTVMNEKYDPDFFVDGDAIRPILGRTPLELGQALMPHRSPEEALEIFHVLAEGELPVMRKEKPVVYPGFEEVIPELASSWQLFIVSNCDSGYIEMFLDVTGLTEYFTDHLCPGDTGEGKAENIRTIMARHNISDAVYIGDTEKDHQACLQAGVPFVYASYGYGDVTGYDAAADSPAELPAVLGSLFGK